jgi:hypothetical protein
MAMSVTGSLWAERLDSVASSFGTLAFGMIALGLGTLVLPRRPGHPIGSDGDEPPAVEVELL